MTAPRHLRLAIIGDTSSLERGLKRAKKATGVFEAGLATLRTGALWAGAAIGAAFVANVVLGTQALMRLERIGAQTNAVIASTGGVAGVTAAQVRQLADSIERKTGIDNEAIMAGQNLLLTFTQVRDAAGAGNDIFTQTTRIMTDMSVAMGTDTRAAAIQLGKALQDPIRGTAALRRVGVSFTEAQEEQIRTLVESGRVMDAQRIILRELEVQFGGVAEAVGKTLPGQITILRQMWGDIQEKMAAKIIPTLLSVVTTITDNWPKIEAVVGRVMRVFSAVVANAISLTIAFSSALLAAKWKAITAFVADIAIAVKALWAKVVALKAATVSLMVLKAFLGPKGWLILAAGIATAVAALGIFNHLSAQATGAAAAAATGMTNLGDAATAAAGGQENLEKALTGAGRAANKNLLAFDQVHSLQEEMGKASVPGLPGLAEFEVPTGIRGLTNAMEDLGAATEKQTGLWETLKNATRTAWSAITTIVASAVSWLSRQWDTLRSVAEERWRTTAFVITAAVDSMRTGISVRWTAISAALNSVWDTIRESARIKWNAVTATIRSAVNGISAIINSFIRAFNAIRITVPPVNIPLLGRRGGFTVAMPRVPQIPMLAKGGIVNRPMLGIVGEAGPEAVIPLRRGTPGIEAIADAVGNAVLVAMRETLRAVPAGQGADSREIILEVDGTRLGRVILPTLRSEAHRTGTVVTVI